MRPTAAGVGEVASTTPVDGYESADVLRIDG
jgi:hypothetical protein